MPDRKDIKDLLMILFLIVFCSLVAFIPIRILDEASCNNYSFNTKRDTKYSVLTCYVKDGNDWYTQNEFKMLLTTKALANKE